MSHLASSLLILFEATYW